MLNFKKSDLILKISKKTNKSVPKRLINDIVNIIINYICEEVSANKTISVNKFGTFYQAPTKPRLVWSNFQEKMILSQSKVNVKFEPHTVFSKLLKDKRISLIEAFKNESAESK